MNDLSIPISKPDDLDTVRRQRAYFTSNQMAASLINALPQGIAILNQSLQLLEANEAFQEFVGAPSAEALVGTPLNVALRCSHLGEEPSHVSGTCLTCGVRMAMMAAVENRRYVGECRILRGDDIDQGTRDLRLTIMPLSTDAGCFTVVSAEDIGSEKRLQNLESIFHHDLRNTAGILLGAVGALQFKDYAEFADELNLLVLSSSERLVSEIESQSQLLQAERGLLELDVVPIESRQTLEGLISLYDARPEYHNCRVQIAEESASFTCESDPVILGRILGNMVKNALEACREGDAVTVGADDNGISCRFWVHNPALVPDDIRGQLFNQSNSTKGSGRGLGTYGMKMLTERYLGGLIGFSSTPETGTIFELTLSQTQ